jgi:hypothetical protein
MLFEKMSLKIKGERKCLEKRKEYLWNTPIF